MPPDSQTRVRAATPADEARLNDLERQFPLVDRLSRRSLRAWIARPGTAWVLEDRGSVRAAAIVSFRATTRVARLYSLVVDQTSRGAGHGTVLLTAVEAVCRQRGLDRIRLEVRRTNRAAIGFYVRAGYVQIGVREGYYGDGEAAIRMEKPLQSLSVTA